MECSEIPLNPPLKKGDVQRYLSQIPPRSPFKNGEDVFFSCDMVPCEAPFRKGGWGDSLLVFAHDEDGIMPSEAEGLGNGRFYGIGVYLCDEIESLHRVV